MNVVILTLTYPPEPAEHIHDLAKYLAKQKHSVTVLTSLPSYPYGRVYNSYRHKLWFKETIDGVNILRLPVIPSHSKSFVGRAIYYLCNAFAILTYLMFSHKRFDVTLAYHPPLTIAIPAIVYKKLRNVPLVYWIQDMWPETIEAHSGITRITKLIGTLSRKAYKYADHIVVLSYGFKKYLIQKEVESESITVIHNWADSSFFSPVQVSANDYRKYNLNEKNFHIFYAGNLGLMQSLEDVVLAAGHLRYLEDLKIVFMGTGVKANELNKLCKKYNLMDKVLFLGRVPQEEVNLCYSLADAFIVHVKDIPLNRITIPHKIYGYMLAGKPVIAAIKGEAKDEILAARAGIDCIPQDPESISRAIETIYRMSCKEMKEMGEHGRRFVCSERNIKVLAARFEDVLLNAVS